MSFDSIIEKRLPVTVITGFLGSGKTTLINNILKNSPNKRIAIIENEFGSLNIDSELIENKNEKEKIFELTNGCICCTKNGELEGVFKDISENISDYDYIIVETTGVANPNPIITSFYSNPLFLENFKLDGVIGVVDCKYFFDHFYSEVETRRQVAYSDVILLNKVSLVSELDKGKVLDKVLEVNPILKVFETDNSVIDIKNILNIGAFDFSKFEELEKSLNNSFSFSNVSSSTFLGVSNKGHLDGVETFCIRTLKPISLEKIDYFIRTIIDNLGKNIFRIKGIVFVKDLKQQLIFQGVHFDVNWKPGRFWREGEVCETKLVFIGKDLNKKDLTIAFDKLIDMDE
jgi:G3E family GTPase